MNLSELLDNQDKEIEVLTDNINMLQEKLNPMVMETTLSEAKSDDTLASHGYAIGDHVARNNYRLMELHHRIKYIIEGVAL